MLDIWKWRIPSFPRGCWTSFSSRPVEMPEVQGNGYFQMLKGISIYIKTFPTGGHGGVVGWRRLGSKLP
jgi:hypothetical protein